MGRPRRLPTLCHESLLPHNHHDVNPSLPHPARPLPDDHPSAKQVLDAWFAKYGLNKLPKYIFGISSGAAFAIKFPRTYPGLAGVVSGKPRG